MEIYISNASDIVILFVLTTFVLGVFIAIEWIETLASPFLTTLLILFLCILFVRIRVK